METSFCRSVLHRGIRPFLVVVGLLVCSAQAQAQSGTIYVSSGYVTINGFTWSLDEYHLLYGGVAGQNALNEAMASESGTGLNGGEGSELLVPHNKYAIFAGANAWGGGAWTAPGHQAFSSNGQTLSYVETWSYAVTASFGIEVGIATAQLEATATHGGQLTDVAMGNNGQWVCWWRRDMISNNTYKIYDEWIDIFGGYHNVEVTGANGYVQYVTGVEALHKITDGYTNCTL